MAVQWQTIYSQVCDILLEGNPGLSLGLLTDAELYTIAAEVLVDFCNKTGIVKHNYSTVASFGVQQYPESSLMADCQGAMFAQTFIYESSDFFLSNSDRAFNSFQNIGNPESYKQDDQPTKRINVSPAPQVNGNDITIPAGGAGYGVIGAVASYSDFTFTADPLTPAGYGVIAGANGNPFLDALNPGFGVIADMVPSTNNLTLQGTALPFQIANIGPQTFIEIVPDSFTPYLKYGVLAKIFGGSNELKDEQKAAFCSSAYKFGINLAAAIMCDVYEED